MVLTAINIKNCTYLQFHNLLITKKLSSQKNEHTISWFITLLLKAIYFMQKAF